MYWPNSEGCSKFCNRHYGYILIFSSHKRYISKPRTKGVFVSLPLLRVLINQPNIQCQYIAPCHALQTSSEGVTLGSGGKETSGSCLDVRRGRCVSRRHVLRSGLESDFLLELDLDIVNQSDICGTYVFDVKKHDQSEADLRNAVVIARQQLLQEIATKGLNVLLTERWRSSDPTFERRHTEYHRAAGI